MSPLWKLGLRLLRGTALGLVAVGGLLVYCLKQGAPPPTHPEIFSQLGHSTRVWSVAWSPNGRTVASGSDETALKLWDASSGTLLRTLLGHSSTVMSVAWSPDGRTVASGSWDRTVKLWDASSGTLLRTLSGHSSLVMSVAWSPDGRTLASGSDDKTLKLWDASSGTLLRTLSAHSERVASVAWSPDGRTLASGSDDKTLKLWDASSGTLLRTLSGHSIGIFSVAWSPDGRTVVSSSQDTTVKLWDPSSGSLLHTLSDHSGNVYSVAWSPDGRTVASGSWDGTVKLWDPSSGTLLRTLSAHSIGVFSVAWSPDSRIIASGSLGGTLKFWDAPSGSLLSSLSGNPYGVFSVAWSPDSRTVVSDSNEGTLNLWDTSSGILVRTLSGHSKPIRAVAWSPNGSTVASGDVEGILKLWDASSGTLLRTLSAHSERVASVAWSPDGRTVASGSDDETLKLWDARSGSLLRTLSGHSSHVLSVAWSPDGRTVASGDVEGILKLWDASSGSLLHTLSDHSGTVTSVAWSSDGRIVASGSWDSTVKLWDASSGSLLRTLSGHSPSVLSVAWSPDGSTVVSSHTDGSIALWQSTGNLEWLSLALPGNIWLTYHPTKLFYTASPEGDELAAVRFGSKTSPVYPLAYYRKELQQRALSRDSSQAPPIIEPKPLRLAWDRFENKAAWLGGLAVLYFTGFTLTLVLAQRRDPMKLARRFFPTAGFTRVEQLSQNLLSLASGRDGQKAYALLWQHDWQSLAQQLPRRPSDVATVPRVYLLYTGRVPESEQFQSFRAQVDGEVIPIPAPALAIALSEGKSRPALQEFEDRFVTRIDPYDEAKPVDDPVWFHGRADLLDRLPTALQQGQHVGLFGLRKVGKTSLIKQLRNRAQDTPIVEIDCQSLEPLAIDYLQDILEKTHAELRRLKIRGLPTPQKLQSAGDFRDRFLALHARWTRSGQQGPILLFLDEIDKLFVDRRRSNSDPVLGEYVRLFRILRALAQEHRCLAVLVAAYRPEVNRQNALTSAAGENPMFMSFQEYFLGALSANDTQTLIKEIGLWRNIRWDPDALVELHALCGGHPFLTRLLASDACDQGTLTQIDKAKVQQAARAVHSNFHKHRIGRYYQESIWNELQEDEQKALQLLAAQEAGLERSALPPQLGEALTQLEHFGLIQQEGERLMIGARLFRQWVAKVA